MFAICHRPSVCRLSVCLSPVTSVRPTQATEFFGNVFTPFGTMAICCKSTGNSRSGIPGNREPPKFPAGIPGNFWNSFGNYGEFIGVLSFFKFLLLIMTVFNLTHCVMCTTHDRLAAFWAKPWMTSLTQLFVFIVFCTFKYWYRKITEQRQNFANSDRYTNGDADIGLILTGHRPRFCIHRPAMEGVLRKVL